MQARVEFARGGKIFAPLGHAVLAAIIADEAAGLLLVKEAGGFISDYRGQDRMTERREYLAASGELHSRLHKLLAGALR